MKHHPYLHHSVLLSASHGVPLVVVQLAGRQPERVEVSKVLLQNVEEKSGD